MKIWSFSSKAKYARLRTLSPFAPYELRRTYRGPCQDSPAPSSPCIVPRRQKVLPVGWVFGVEVESRSRTVVFILSSKPLRTLRSLRLKTQLHHSPTLNSPTLQAIGGLVASRTRLYQRSFVAIRDIAEKHLPAIRLKFNARYYTLFFFQRQISGTSIYDCAILLPSSSSIKIP